MTAERLVFVHPFLLHYHIPRLQALAKECERTSVSLHSIELASYMDIYREFFENKETGFNHVTLFPGQSLERIPQNAMWRSLKTTLDRLRPDVVFIYGYSLRVMRQVRAWARRNKVAVVMISDSNEFDRKRYRILEFLKSLFVSRVDAAFVGGSSSGQYLHQLGIPQERIVFGYDVIDHGTFLHRAAQNQANIKAIQQKWDLPERYFLFIGRLVKEKNVRTLLDAYASYANALGTESVPWNLVICGNGPEAEALQRYAHNGSSQDGKSILFYGLVKQPEIIDFYSCASCFVLPSVSESWGLVINEAMACGLPVIASKRTGCAADLVQEGVTGWLFDPYSPSELTSAMLNMHRLGDPARAEMGARGQQLASEWGLERFSEGALSSARIASDHWGRSQGAGRHRQ
jgi:1,2-diacylglycerol 3-alpha-glucosyltransferase